MLIWKTTRKPAIEKIYLLTKQDVEFNEELRKKLGIASSASSALIDDERLNQIYEYCIEKIIRKQSLRTFTRTSQLLLLYLH